MAIPFLDRIKVITSFLSREKEMLAPSLLSTKKEQVGESTEAVISFEKEVKLKRAEIAINKIFFIKVVLPKKDQLK